jgi:dipeptidase
MCDTMVATRQMTADGVTVFGKNSDREPNEAQYIAWLPADDHPRGTRLRCTYIDIPQVEHTHTVLLSRPFWMWGAEMGANELGVVIGNEAIFSKVPGPKEEALLGMDLLRLALERASTARQALDVITSLLEQHGQGGHAGFMHPTFYHNSFLIADPQDAWVLETVERRWAARQVRGAASISNCLTIGSEFDLSSNDLVSFIQAKGWSKGRQGFDFARDYSDFIYTTFARGRQRCQRSQQLLKAKGREDSIFAVIATLRDHGENVEAGGFKPDRGLFNYDICAHAGFGPVRATQTTGSLVAYMHPQHPVYFMTGTAAPCTSIFKPVWVDAGIPDLGPQPTGTYDPAALFWQHERLHRLTMQDYSRRLELYREERDQLEARFVRGALELASAPGDERLAFSKRCFDEARAAEELWLERVSKAAGSSRLSWHYNRAWKQFNQQAEM